MRNRFYFTHKINSTHFYSKKKRTSLVVEEQETKEFFITSLLHIPVLLSIVFVYLNYLHSSREIEEGR